MTAITTTIRALILLAEQASARAAEARARAPKPRRLLQAQQDRTGLLVAASMEEQERAAWAFALQFACDAMGDAETGRRINAHFVHMDAPGGMQWVQQPGMATQHLREHVARLSSDDISE